MGKKSLYAIVTGVFGCMTGVILTILIAAIALFVFIVRWGNRQDWNPDSADTTIVATDSINVSEDDHDTTNTCLPMPSSLQ